MIRKFSLAAALICVTFTLTQMHANATAASNNSCQVLGYGNVASQFNFTLNCYVNNGTASWFYFVAFDPATHKTIAADWLTGTSVNVNWSNGGLSLQAPINGGADTVHINISAPNSSYKRSISFYITNNSGSTVYQDAGGVPSPGYISAYP